VATSELVSRRLAELQAAQLLRDARTASHRNDWRRVDALLAQAEQRFAGNPWVAAVVESIRRLARSQDRELFMKEALYSSAKFSRRLAERDEVIGMGQESAKPSFLRRRSAEGQSEYERRKPGGNSRP